MSDWPLERATLKNVSSHEAGKGAAEVADDVGRKNGLLRFAPHLSELGRPAAKPRAKSGGVERSELLTEQRRANAGQYIAHAASRHPGCAGGIE